jgi:hypothetical protein
MTDSASVSAAGQAPQVMHALRAAAKASGVDFGYLLETAKRESALDPSAKNPTSSATGLFQFTDETWLATVERYGAKHGVSTEGLDRKGILALRKDPETSARMAGELTRENAAILEKKLGRPATSGELYMAHFMGPSEAAKLAQAASSGSKASAAELFPAAAKANENVFRAADGSQLDAAGLYARLTQHAERASVGVFAAERADPQAMLMARAGTAQLTSALMAALFFEQEER